jgi:hypothetical protein
MKLPRILSDAELDEKFAERRAKRKALVKKSIEKWKASPKGQAWKSQKRTRTKI